MNNVDIFDSAPVLLNLESSSEESAICQMIHLLAGRNEVTNIAELERAVLARQKLSPPLLGNGVALPHARTPVVKGLAMVVARCQDTLFFGPEKVPVRLIFLFAVPINCIGEYLASVARLTRLLRRPDTLAGLLGAEDESSFRNLLK